MTCTTKINNSKLVDVHINNLNNIQKIILRLSNIGVTIFSLTITIFSIMIPIVYSLSVVVYIRLILSLSLFLIVICFFIAHLINLRNEKLWIKIYNDKCKIKISTLKTDNSIYDILNVDFNKYKKVNDIKFSNLIKSWWSVCWFIMILFILATIVLIFFIY